MAKRDEKGRGEGGCRPEGTSPPPIGLNILAKKFACGAFSVLYSIKIHNNALLNIYRNDSSRY